MATIDITRKVDGDNFGETELNTICDELETFFNETLISDDNIQDDGLSGTKLRTGTISATELASNSVSTSELKDDSVTAAKLASDTAGTGLSQAASGALDLGVDDSTVEISSDVVRLKDSGITTAKLASSSANNTTIADGAITKDKLDPSPNIQTNSATSTSLAQAITLTTGRVLVVASFNASGSSNTVTLDEGGTDIASSTSFGLGPNCGGSIVLSRNPGAGSITYTLTSGSSQALAIQLIEI